MDLVYTWRENLLDPQGWNRYAYARTAAGLATAGSVANDVLLAIGVGEAFQAVRAGLECWSGGGCEKRNRAGTEGGQRVERPVAAAEARGETIIGPEITVEAPTARTRRTVPVRI